MTDTNLEQWDIRRDNNKAEHGLLRKLFTIYFSHSNTLTAVHVKWCAEHTSSAIARERAI